MRRLLMLGLWGCGGPSEAVSELCGNAVDDDDDGHVDCADQDCDAACHEQCGNGTDDDGDALADCFDPECAASCTEVCGNGVDDDGDGRTDCADTACVAVCAEDCTNATDDDGDLVVDCWDADCLGTCDVDGDGHWSTAFGFDDCDDAKADVYPGAPEIWYDGIDNDCNAATDDDDQDGDGVPVDDDCDDTDAATYPGAPEQCGDGVVNDCDGDAPLRVDCFGDRTIGSGDAAFLGTTTGNKAGEAISFVGDLQGDGFVDVVVAAEGYGALDNGAAYFVSGPFIGQVALVEHPVVTGEDSDFLGRSVAGGKDLTGDGLPDAVVGAYNHDAGFNNSGTVYVFTGEPIGDLGVAAAAAALAPSYDYAFAGEALALSADLTGDGLPDLAIGAIQAVTGGDFTGGVFVAPGPMAGSIDLSDERIALQIGLGTGDDAGAAVAAGSDINADGVDDLLVGAPYNDFGGIDAGGAYAVYGPIVGVAPLSDADAFFPGGPGDESGTSVAALGDVDGDGFGDWAVSSPYGDACAPSGGEIALLRGPSGALVGAADAVLCGIGEGDNLGSAVVSAGRIDADDVPDLAAGAAAAELGGAEGGAAYVVSGTDITNADIATVATIRISGPEFVGVGTALAGGADATGDGFDDLLVGAPGADGGAASSGLAALFTFGL